MDSFLRKLNRSLRVNVFTQFECSMYDFFRFRLVTNKRKKERKGKKREEKKEKERLTTIIKQNKNIKILSFQGN